jgi:GNAT superfamily N-acetyltransferase
MIRYAQVSDIPDIIRMSKVFYAMTHYPEFAPYDEETAERLSTLLIENHILFVAEAEGKVIGMVGGMLLPWLFNSSVITGHEIIWWVDREYQKTGLGIELLKALESEVAARGASRLQMAHFVHMPYSASIYESLGYKHTESIYLKEV